jgi:flagellar hook protein FlgE
MVFETIKEYAPDHVKNLVYEDVIGQMEQLEKDGFALPKDYDKRKHDMDDNEITLFEQQLARDRKSGRVRATNLINFSASMVSGMCRMMQIDAIRTKKLKATVAEALREGEFDDSLDGMSTALRGTVAENPMVSTIIKLVEKVNEAHEAELEDERKQKEKEERERTQRNQNTIASLNRLREPPVVEQPGHGSATLRAITVPADGVVGGTSQPSFAVPPPPNLMPRRNQVEDEKKKS